MLEVLLASRSLPKNPNSSREACLGHPTERNQALPSQAAAYGVPWARSLRNSRDQDSDRLLGPEWLIEGTAELWVWRVGDEHDFAALEKLPTLKHNIPSYVDLMDQHPRRLRNASASYETMVLASDLLVTQAGARSLVEFWRQTGAYFAEQRGVAGLTNVHAGRNAEMWKFTN